jgi:endonuclease III
MQTDKAIEQLMYVILELQNVADEISDTPSDKMETYVKKLNLIEMRVDNIIDLLEDDL